MPTLSVIVPAHNSEPTIADALASAEQSIACLHDQEPAAIDVEVIIVDDGSSDATLRIALGLAKDRPHYRVLHRPEPSSPACARNCGVAASHGDLILFLDDDDRFLPDHIHTCLRGLQDPDLDFVKTAVAVSDPVHPDWASRIGNSLVLNLAVRRTCHDRIGGFPDFHLVRRDGDGFRPEVDLFRMIEDVFYNELLTETCRGNRIDVETVLYRRHPGNSFDRQYEKFSRPFGEVREDFGDEFNFRVQMSHLIIKREKRRIAHELTGREPGSEILPTTSGQPAGETDW